MGYLLGIDLGSSSVKVALVETSATGVEPRFPKGAENGQCVASASYPETEAPIKALEPGWAEQRPADWWEYFKQALKVLKVPNALKEVAAIGISYQMHGLVCLDKDLRPLRDAIIWCDSRGVPYGQRAFDALGHEWCLSHLLNSPGNFTAAKLACVKENEPELFEKIRYVMLPGDWLALRLSGTPATTACGLSEMMLWDYSDQGSVATNLMDYFGFPASILPPLVPTFGEQGRLSASAAEELGLTAGIPIAYRAGDQPNNALSLGVLNPGEVAATAGTSGVVYGIKECVNALTRKCASADAPATDTILPNRKGTALSTDEIKSNTAKNQSHNNTLVNTFLHVNHTLGVMHCVNGCGILNAWMRRNVADGMSYDEMNAIAATVPAGSDGVSIIPFGNGAERVLRNSNPGCSIHGVDFNRHSQAHLLRASQEGIAFALYYGMELMGNISTIRAGKANMFLSPLFRETLASVSGATIEMYETDGSVGAARGAGIGAGIYNGADEAFKSLELLGTTEPSPELVPVMREAYGRWKSILEKQINS